MGHMTVAICASASAFLRRFRDSTFSHFDRTSTCNRRTDRRTHASHSTHHSVGRQNSLTSHSPMAFCRTPCSVISRAKLIVTSNPQALYAIKFSLHIVFVTHTPFTRYNRLSCRHSLVNAGGFVVLARFYMLHLRDWALSESNTDKKLKNFRAVAPGLVSVPQIYPTLMTSAPRMIKSVQ